MNARDDWFATILHMPDKMNSPDEVLDLVDGNDRVIGEVLMRDANSNPALIHREVAILLYDDDDRLLLQQRSFKKSLEPGAWTISCAGHVPKGMAPLAAAHMELQEELGFDAKLQFVKKLKDAIPTQTRFFYFYLGRYAGEKIVIEPTEVEQAGLFSRLEYERLCSTENVTERTDEIIQQFWQGELDHFKRVEDH